MGDGKDLSRHEVHKRERSGEEQQHLGKRGVGSQGAGLLLRAPAVEIGDGVVAPIRKHDIRAAGLELLESMMPQRTGIPRDMLSKCQRTKISSREAEKIGHHASIVWPCDP